VSCEPKFYDHQQFHFDKIAKRRKAKSRKVAEGRTKLRNVACNRGDLQVHDRPAVIARSWASTESSARRWKGLRLRWFWRLPELEDRAETLVGEGHEPRYSKGLAILLMPVAQLGVLLQDFLSAAKKFGFNLAWGNEIVVFERYHNARVLVELLLDSRASGGVPNRSLPDWKFWGDAYLR
jgi:hypothetical protein